MAKIGSEMAAMCGKLLKYLRNGFTSFEMT